MSIPHYWFDIVFWVVAWESKCYRPVFETFTFPKHESTWLHIGKGIHIRVPYILGDE